MKDRLSLNFNTKLCAVIGNPVSHSMSPAIHNAGYAELGLDFAYVPCQVEDVEGMLNGMRAMHNFRGLSVTIPHKVTAMQYVDEVVETDRVIGSINTIVKQDGKLVGMGTDGPGALKALTDAAVNPDGKTVLMLGCGGAARAIAFTLAQQTRLAELSLLDVNDEMLQGLTADLRANTGAQIRSELMNDVSLTAAMAKADIIIHCTPIGMHPKEEASLVPAELFRPGQVVFDIVYNPLRTKLLTDAEAKGLQTISGVEMFINQAVLQFEIFTGGPAPEEIMRKVVMENLSQ
ncbi:MAG: shikimate dehydrogenase [Desulfuromonadales bacterium]|nr:shikimate dehydrogenase [Desulfuromonadales bacterium]